MPFTNGTQSAGLHFKHCNGAFGLKPLPETMGGGCAVFDCGAGWLERIVANDTARNFVFHSQRHGTFHEFGMATGLALGSSG